MRGYIVVPCIESANDTTYRQVTTNGAPLVFVDRYLSGLEVDAVLSDNRRGGYMATRHLLELGHRRIVVLGVGGAVSVQHRLEGHKQALAEYGVPFDPALVHPRKQNNFEDAYDFIGRFLTAHPDVTAAFCLPDEAAWGCLQRLAEMDIRVPEQFSVVGYDDNADICSRVRPRLTTVRQQKREMGRSAARRLAWRLGSDDHIPPEVVSLPVELVVRESAARAPEAAAITK